MTIVFTLLMTVLTFSLGSENSSKIVFERTQKMNLDRSSAQWLVKNSDPAWMLEIEGVTNVVSIKKPYSFLRGKVGNGQFYFVSKNVKLKRIKLTPKMLAQILGVEPDNEPDAFEVMELVGLNGEVDLGYCSCGGATVEKDGDGCFFFADAVGVISCDGECSGELSEQRCGVTVVDFSLGSPPKKIIME